MSDEQTFEGWAIVEVMGHQRFIGEVTERVIAGAGFIQVNIPKTEKTQAWTKLIGPSSVYAITPVSEEIARAMVAKRQEQPVQAYQLTTEMTRKVHHLLDYGGDEEDESDIPY